MAKLDTRTKGALWLLIAPTGLLIITFIFFAIINWVFNPTMWPTPDTEAFAPTPIGITIANILLFVTGAVSVMTWLPGIIIGIVLLATKK
ncbi:MAG: hypothetical protein ABIP50_04060 [Candidatus Saccharimonadales bacterium]